MKSFKLFDNEDARLKATNILMNGKDSDFWKLVKEVVQLNVEYLKELIISEKDDNGLQLTEKQLIEARMMVQAFREVMGTPEHFIKLFSGRDVETVSDDPYEQVEPDNEANDSKSEGDLPDDFDTSAY